MLEASKTKPMRIGQLAAALGLNPKTIRYYEELGLLPPAKRSDAGYRLYDMADLERLQFIGKAKLLGLSLDEISTILSFCDGGERPCEHVLHLLDGKLAAVDLQLRALVEFRQELVKLREAAAENITTDSHFCRIIERHMPAHQKEDVEG
jgi:DNA-binding transcriptional MerR regulator